MSCKNVLKCQKKDLHNNKIEIITGIKFQQSQLYKMFIHHAKKITKFRVSFISPTLYQFLSTSSQPVSHKQSQVPSRIQFISQNQIHFKQILSLSQSKQQLHSIYLQQLHNLSINNEHNQKIFKFSQNYNEDLYAFIKQNILAETQKGFDPQSKFMQYAHYYFQKQGKKVRPLMIKLLQSCLMAKNKQQISKQKSQEISLKNKKWAALIEILHIASLAHDDIIDQSPSRRGQISQHLKYGKRMAVFSGNYIISKASREIFQFQSPKLFQIYSTAMDNLATGEIIQALTKNKVSSDSNALQSIIANYMNKTYYKTAALMANALRAVPLLCQPQNPQYQIQSFRVGQHFGLAFQIVDDILDYISTETEMGKQEVADIRQGNVTAPVYFTLYHEKQQKPINEHIKELKRKNKTKQQALQIKKWVHEGKGIQLSYLLAVKHIQTGMKYLQKMGVSQEDKAPWIYLAHKLLTRRK